MLQRTRAEQVLPVYRHFCRRFRTPGAFVQAGCPPVFDRLGLVWREASLRALAKALEDKAIPVDRRELLSLPGVGPYIAGAMRSLHFGVRDTIIDANVVRLYARFFGFSFDGETRRKRWLMNLADELTPRATSRLYNYGLIDLTRQVCRQIPACDVCPLALKCAYPTRAMPGRIMHSLRPSAHLRGDHVTRRLRACQKSVLGSAR